LGCLLGLDHCQCGFVRLPPVHPPKPSSHITTLHICLIPTFR
jgi:hypothetical protein